MNNNELLQTYIEKAKIHPLGVSQKALTKIEGLGIPTTKWEDWKYTSPAKMLTHGYNTVAELKEVSSSNYEDYVLNSSNIIVYVNGILDENKTKLVSGIELEAVKNNTALIEASLKDDNDFFDAFNVAFNTSSNIITLKKNQEISEPLTIVHITTDELSNSSARTYINAEKFSKLDVLEVFLGAEGVSNYMNNATTIIDVQDGANLTHVKLQLDSAQAFHVGKVDGKVSKDGTLSTYTMSLGSKMARNNIAVDLNSPGAHANVHGLYALREEQHVDNFSLINHTKEHTTSDQLFKSLLDDSSKGIFTGKIIVHRDAQLVDSSQLNRNLLLSKKAHAETRPQLEVYADDVKCAHGATIGQMNDEELFYLRSRGISQERAYAILCHAFANDVIEKIDNEQIVVLLNKALFDFFEKHSIN